MEKCSNKKRNKEWNQNEGQRQGEKYISKGVLFEEVFLFAKIPSRYSIPPKTLSYKISHESHIS
jgi:hypothetical protein